MTTIGEVSFNVDFDGKRLPVKARILARQVDKAFGGVRITALDKSMERLTRNIENQTSAWRRLSANTRQWTLIIGAIAAGGQQIATLSSALGAGLLVAGAGLSSVVVGGLAAVAVFKNLNGELEDLDPLVRPAAAAFQRLGESFERIQDAIQIAALRDAAGAFDSLAGTVDALTPAFEVVGLAIGRLIRDFATGIAPGTRNFENLEEIVRVSGRQFEKLLRVVGTFGEGLLEAFANRRLQRSLTNLLEYFDDLAESFLEFTQSEGFDTFIDNADRVFGAFGRLLEEVGTALSELVDQEAVDQLVGFLDNLAEFQQPLGELLETLGELDIFGLLAEALAVFGEALLPLAGPAQDLAAAINDVVQSGIETLGPIFEDIASTLGPVVQAISDFIDENPKQVADALLAIAGAAVVLKGAQGLAGLASLISGVVGQLANLKFSPKAILGGAALGGFASVFGAELGRQISENPTISQAGGQVGGILSGAIAGGMAAGLPGALVGALTGAVTSVDWQSLGDSYFGDGSDAQTGLSLALNQGLIGVGALAADGFRAIGEGNGQEYAAGLQQALNDLVPGLGDTFATIGQNVATFFAQVGQTFTTFGEGVANGFTNIGSFFNTFFTTIGTAWNTFWSGLVSFVFTVVSGFVTFVNTTFTNIITFFFNFFTSVATGWNTFWTGLSTIVTTVWSALSNFVRTAVTNVQTFISNGIATIGQIWNGFWSGFGQIVQSVWSGITSVVSGAVSFLKGIINGFITAINSAVDAISGLSGGLINLPNIPKFANGGLVTGPTRALVGEAGPELIVPLTRPLGQVNPIVRDVARYARGEGGAGGPSKIVNVQPGAIVVQTMAPATQVAGAVLDRLVANAAAI